MIVTIFPVAKFHAKIQYKPNSDESVTINVKWNRNFEHENIAKEKRCAGVERNLLAFSDYTFFINYKKCIKVKINLFFSIFIEYFMKLSFLTSKHQKNFLESLQFW